MVPHRDGRRVLLPLLISFVSFLAPPAGAAEPNVTLLPSAKLVEFATPKEGVAATYLRCEYLVDPLGIDATKPRLSWIITSPERGQRQTAYQVLVSSAREKLAADAGDLWDSGRVQGNQTSQVIYGGRPLRSHLECFWKVRVWDKDGKSSSWSEPAHWSMGILDPSEWKGDWIGYDADRGERPAPPRRGDRTPRPAYLPPVPLIRHEFQVEKPLRRATLYAAALGLADFRLNGQAAYSDWFISGWTSYDKRVYYRTYDVTKLLMEGRNAIAAVLADGWYSGYVGYGRRRDFYGQNPRLRAQLHLEYADGTTADIATGPEWKATTAGPWISADFLKGESYDALRELVDWSALGFDASAWQAVNVGAEVKPLIQAHPAEPVVAFSELKPVKVTEPRPGVYVFDMGQNFAGVVRLKIVDAKPGQNIVMRFAERLQDDGNIYTTNLRAATATDTYICASRGVETWEPRFTYHGFQFVEVTGLATTPDDGVITGVALTSATPVAGEFSCSSPMLNKLYNNIVWTQRANYIDIPTDCPQRDERMGWTGDAQIYVHTATLNSDVAAFYNKWLVDLDDGQLPDGHYPRVAPRKVDEGEGGPAWADAGVICPWTIYKTYGDRQFLEEHYEPMARFIAYYEKRSLPGPLPPERFHAFGDWLNVRADTPREVIYMAYFAHSTRLMAQIADVLGKNDDAMRYRDLLEKIRTSFQQNFVDADGKVRGDTQTCYVLAIAYGLLTEEQEKKAGEYLVERIRDREWHLSSGFVGTKDLMLVLARIGRNDVAYRLALNESYPSWGFSIANGATSIWERWNGWTPQDGFADPGMNSFSHYSFGAVYQWMAENIGGIRAESPGYEKIVIAPQPGGGLTSARIVYNSIRGRIESDWKLDAGKFELRVSIPANTMARVELPAKAGAKILEGGGAIEQAAGVRLVKHESERTLLDVESGMYEFAVQ
jgi:alpha-L-rhamnosidase